MRKYAMLRDALARELPGIELHEAPRVEDQDLALVHATAYVEDVVGGQLSAKQQGDIGFPWSVAMVERSRRSVGASVAAVQSAQQSGVAGNLAGGTHHAFADRGGGFCVFNDLAVSARVAQRQWAQSHAQALQVAVIDLDVHQGNGTADIFKLDASVFTLSLHGEKNFPFQKVSGDLDVGLPDGCDDAAYLQALQQALAELDQRFAPDLVLYLAGADPYVHDRLGRLSLSLAGLAERDSMVFDWCYERALPVAFAMGGGYSERIEDTVAAQVNTYRAAFRSWQRWQNRVHAR